MLGVYGGIRDKGGSGGSDNGGGGGRSDGIEGYLWIEVNNNSSDYYNSQ